MSVDQLRHFPDSPINNHSDAGDKFKKDKFASLVSFVYDNPALPIPSFARQLAVELVLRREERAIEAMWTFVNGYRDGADEIEDHQRRVDSLRVRLVSEKVQTTGRVQLAAHYLGQQLLPGLTDLTRW